MKKLALLGWLILAAACGGSTGPIAIGGPWQVTGNFLNPSIQVSCQFSVSATITQMGATFIGTYDGAETCSGPGGVFPFSVSGQFSGGQLTSSIIAFYDDAGCRYSGSVSANRMGGATACDVPVAGTNYHFAGSWNASR